MAIDNAFLDARITRTKELIIAYEDAIDAITANGQSYKLDTGQTSQTKTQADLGSMRLELESLDNRLATLCARRFGASFYARGV